jgi:hypothetical protein
MNSLLLLLYLLILSKRTTCKTLSSTATRTLISTGTTKKLPVRSDITTTLLRTQTPSISIPQLPDKSSKCFGLPKEMCRNTQDMQDAKEAEDECQKMFCDPLCLQSTWSCEIVANGLFKVASISPFKESLCAQFIGWGCSDASGPTAKCCDYKDEMLYRWVEDRMYGDDYPQAHLPMGVCTHDAADKVVSDLKCEQCKANVVVTLKNRADQCEDTGAGHADWSEETVQKFWEPQTLLPMANAGTHRTLHERCTKLQEKMEEILPKLTAKVNDRVCECMGCCAPKDNNDWCFFPFMQQV